MTTKLVTPVGEIKLPKLDVEGKKTVALTFDPKGNEKFLDEINKVIAESKFPKAKLYKEDKSRVGDTEEFEPNGKIIMNFISHYPIKYFDAKLQPIGELKNLGWGSKAKISFTVKEFEVEGKKGLCKYINGIQILELVEGASGESVGFTEEEGYAQPEQKEVPWEE